MKKLKRVLCVMLMLTLVMFSTQTTMAASNKSADKKALKTVTFKARYYQNFYELEKPDLFRTENVYQVEVTLDAGEAKLQNCRLYATLTRDRMENENLYTMTFRVTGTVGTAAKKADRTAFTLKDSYEFVVPQRTELLLGYTADLIGTEAPARTIKDNYAPELFSKKGMAISSTTNPTGKFNPSHHLTVKIPIQTVKPAR